MRTRGSMYRLVGHDVVEEPNLSAWSESWKGTRIIAHSWVGDIMISTVFLGVDHSLGDGPPVLFETMVFGGPLDGFCRRYNTWLESAKGHARVVYKVNKQTPIWRQIVGWVRRKFRFVTD